MHKQQIDAHLGVDESLQAGRDYGHQLAAEIEAGAGPLFDRWGEGIQRYAATLKPTK
jgi:hypothetical protein